MEEHAVPRQITTFEFKLIGFMTLKQFLYLLIFVPMAYIIFRLFPIPIVNMLLAAVVAGFGAALAFLPLNDRPLDVWIKNLVRRLTSPTQYMYHKENQALRFLHELYFVSDPHKVLAHVESQEKLADYLSKTKQATNATLAARKQHVQALLQNPSAVPKQVVGTIPRTSPPVISQQNKAEVQTVVEVPNSQQPLSTNHGSLPTPTVIHSSAPASSETMSQSFVATQGKQPYLVGVIKNNKQIPLPGILVYIKDQTQTPLRLLKTNPHGVFATYNPLPEGDYSMEAKDPKGSYFFDTMNFTIAGQTPAPMEIYSKELL